MRLKQSISTNSVSYSIIRDYNKLDGKRTTCIYENLGNYDKLKERFGEEDTMGKVKEYIDSLNKMIKENKEPVVNLELNPNKLIEKNVNRSFFSGHIFLRKIYYDLQIDKICENIKNKYKFTFDINKVVECLVFARIIWPSSKLSTYNQSRRFLGNYDFTLQHVYRTLKYLANEMDEIQKSLFKYSNQVINRNYNVIYYDCTNYFFYTEENDFQRYAISKQHQPLPLVQMGLFMDADGYPFAMNINAGNTSESKTMIPSEEKFLKDYNLEGKKIIVCTDAAMCTDEIKKFNAKDGRGFIITQSIKKLSKKLQEFALDKSGWRILGNIKDIYNLDEIDKNENLRSQYYETVFYKETESETKSVKQALIITFSFKYKDWQHKIKSQQFEKAENTVEETNKNNKTADKPQKLKLTKNPNDPKRFIKASTFTSNGDVAENIVYSVDRKIFEEEEKYNGFYGITTNLMDDTPTIVKVMKGRWEIEESFRIMKHDFDAGTVYVSNQEAIEGHFITCFLSLFIYRYLEHMLDDKYTIYEIVSKLREMKMLEYKGKGYVPIQNRSELTDDLHRFLGLNTDYEIITYKKLREIFKSMEKSK